MKPGDTLSGIAAVTGCSMERLLTLNSATIKYADNIEAGWVLDLCNRASPAAEPKYPGGHDGHAFCIKMRRTHPAVVSWL